MREVVYFLKRINERKQREDYNLLNIHATLKGIKLPTLEELTGGEIGPAFDPIKDAQLEKAAFDAHARMQREHGERERTFNKN